MSMQKILGFVFFMIFGLFYSCAGNTSSIEDKTETEKAVRQAIYTLGMTPDSLQSPEQKALASKMEMIVYEHCVIKDKRLELTISKKEFKTMGVPEIYYDLLKKDIEDINRCLDGTKTISGFVPDSVIDALKKSQDEYFAAKRLKRVE
jgi:hypothetical protein